MQDTSQTNTQTIKPLVVANKKPLLLIGILGCLVVSSISFMLGYALNYMTQSIGEEIQPTLSVSPTVSTTPAVTVSSAPSNELKYIKAEVPQGWTLKEYADGILSPTSNIGEGYQGFNGLQIINPEREVVFEMYAAQGLGGSPFCKEIPKFIDTDPEYIKAIEEYAATWDEQTEVRDLSSVTYKDYNFFGTPIRYVAEELFFGTGSYTGNEFNNFSGFNSTCDAVHNSVIINSPSTYLYWKYNPGSESTQKVNLNYQVISHAKAEDMTGLDLILSTLEEQY